MKPEEIEILRSDNIEDIKKVLEFFNETYSNSFNFRDFNVNGQWKIIWDAIFNILRDQKKASIFPQCLSCIKILARDEQSIGQNNIQNDFEILLQIADLDEKNVQQSPQSINSTEAVVEALKCLCNMVYLSAECQKYCLKNSSINGILKRVRSSETFAYNIEYFDMKLLFLITALEPSARMKVRDYLNGVTYLTEWLDLKVKENDKSDQQIDLICEILKVLFNITVNVDKSSKDENEILYRRLTAVIRYLLFDFGEMKTQKQCYVITNSIHLLTNIPTGCLSELMIGSTLSKNSKNPKESEELFEGKNVKAIEILLNYLRKILNDKEKSSPNNEELPPILTVLVKCVRCNSIMRHYIRSIILPPLKDVSKRPEVGNELRNHLCRFLTIPQQSIRDLTADLLFVCCKENVGRMIKYTGYGNAAGLFASRGILDCRKKENVEYSSDSEDSDTEEYKQMQHGINPVIGCYEAPRSKPMEGMSEEQKEYEAMQLVNLMDQLQRQGIVQPCRIGDDGKPEPVDHILQLQEEIPQQQIDKKNKN